MNELWYYVQLFLLLGSVMLGLLAVVYWATQPDFGLTVLPT